MRAAFDSTEGLVIVPTVIGGPRKTQVVSLAVDTGATCTTINRFVLEAIGIPFGWGDDRVEIATAGGLGTVSRVKVGFVEALGIRKEFPHVLANEMGHFTSFDGLLGLDFLRGHRLTLDFREGFLSLD